jgi:hypothetical protein
MLLTGCSSNPVNKTPPILISELVFENQTRMTVSAVRLLVPATGGFVSCGNINAGTECSTTFPEREYTGNEVEITWSQAGQIYSTGLFTILLPDDIETDKHAYVRVVLAGPGSAGAFVMQR